MRRPPSEQLAEGIRLFNEKQYFECHEVLEELWREQEDPERQFTQGLIQAAVALYHLDRGNVIGAKKLVARALPRLRPFCPTVSEFDVSLLCAQLERIANEL